MDTEQREAQRPAPPGFTDQEWQDYPHQRWVGERWMELRAAKPGMTRGELLEHWQPQGGISYSTYQSFFSRRCRYFLIDVRFEPYTGPDARPFDGDYDPRDVITQVSPITVGLPAMD